MGLGAMSPRAAGLCRMALFGFAWINIVFWLICFFRLAVLEKFTLKFVPNIPYHFPTATPPAFPFTLFEASTYVLALVVEFFVPPLLAALAIALSEMLPQGEPHFSKTMAKVGRVLGWQVPGRRFWLWWCNGLSLGELLFWCGYMGAIASWLEFYLAGQLEYIHAIWDTVGLSHTEMSQMRLEAYALCVGLALYPCFWGLYWPVAHDSFLNHMLGLPWQAMIKYHRWMGHVTVHVMTLHGVLYFILWAWQHRFWVEFSSWKDSIPFFPGTLSWLGALALQITSIWYIRRRWFGIFYKVHIIGFVVMTIFACIHYARTWFYFLPGLMPWAVDLVFRFAQGSSMTTITSATISDDKTVATLELTLADGLVGHPLHDYMINVPSISRWAWHPFTVARAVGNKVTLNIKKYTDFTADLLEQLERGTAVPVRVQGPIGLQHAEHPWLRYPVLVCITGGIGISPVLAMLHTLIANRNREPGATPAAGPKRVIVVWAARHKSEFTVLDETVLTAASGPSSWLTIAPHYTGIHMERASSIDKTQVTAEQVRPGQGSDSSDTGSEGGKDAAQHGERAGGCPLGLSDMVHFKRYSPLGFSLMRPVQPKHGHYAALHKIIVILLVNIGGFCGLSLASAYYAEGNALGLFLYDGSTDFFYWKYGALLILGGFVGGLGLPVFATHTWALWRYQRDVRRGRHGISTPSTPSTEGGGGKAIEAVYASSYSGLKRSDLRPAGRYASTLVGGRVGVMETGAMLDIAEHRPDIRATLQEATNEATELAEGADVGVYVAGPQGMVRATKRMVTDLNRSRAPGAPALHFHQETWEL